MEQFDIELSPGVEQQEFESLCQDIAVNKEGITSVAIHWFQQASAQDVATFTQAMKDNQTVKELHILIFDYALSDVVAQEFGKMLETNTKLDTLGFWKHNTWNQQFDLAPLWESCAKSKSLCNFWLGFGSSQGEIACFVRNLVDPSLKSITLNLGRVHVGPDDTKALIDVMGKPGVSHKMQLYISSGCVFDSIDDFRRFASALGTTKFISHLGVHGRLCNDGAVAFGEAAATTVASSLAFCGCNDDALRLITAGIEKNLTVRNVKLGGDNKLLQQHCQLIANNTVKLNIYGRRYLKEGGVRHGKLEAFWIMQLGKLCRLQPTDPELHGVMYSWIRDYPEIFLRAAGLGGSQRKRKESPTAIFADQQCAKKKAKTFDS